MDAQMFQSYVTDFAFFLIFFFKLRNSCQCFIHCCLVWIFGWKIHWLSEWLRSNCKNSLSKQETRYARGESNCPVGCCWVYNSDLVPNLTSQLSDCWAPAPMENMTNKDVPFQSGVLASICSWIFPPPPKRNDCKSRAATFLLHFYLIDVTLQQNALLKTEIMPKFQKTFRLMQLTTNKVKVKWKKIQKTNKVFEFWMNHFADDNYS